MQHRVDDGALPSSKDEGIRRKAGESEHSTESDQRWQTEDLAQRTNCQGKDQKIERPISCAARGHFYKIRVKPRFPSFPNQMHHGSKTRRKSQRLDPLSTNNGIGKIMQCHSGQPIDTDAPTISWTPILPTKPAAAAMVASGAGGIRALSPARDSALHSPRK